ncbi:MAG: thermonuclease family protein [Bacilli bacterium]|nr:thermonuclease family protein [Bacilli bacterium]
MKLKKLFLLGLASLSLGLTSCGGGSSSPAASSVAPETSSVPAESSPIASNPDASTDSASSSIVAPEESSSDASALPAWHDYARDGSVKLGLDYKGHTFMEDGIEQVTIRKSGDSYIGFIDGDTVHFSAGDNTVIKARFFGVDTPESTGKVQPWGKEASDYTKKVLKEANENGTIVISSPQKEYGIPEPDSTGSRYVSLVWINLDTPNANYENLILLNLLIVQDGYSWVKNVSDIPEYETTFYAAQDQAKAYELNLFSGTIPDSFPKDEYEIVSVLDLKREIVACIEDSSHVNAYHNKRVIVYGTVAGFSNNILYLQDYVKEYNEDGSETGRGEYAGINIFVGMTSIPSKFTAKGTYISVPGLAQDSDNFGFQITDTNFPRVSYDAKKDAQVILRADQNTEEHALHPFEYTPAQLQQVITQKTYEPLFCNVVITDAMKVTGGYDSDSDSNFTLQFGRSYSFSVYVTFSVTPDPDDPATTWNSFSYFVDHNVRISGVFVARKTTSGKWVFQINPSSNADIEVIL